MEHLSRQIAERWSRRHCVLTGHGSTAIYLALKAIGGSGEVLIPAIGCPSIAQVVLYAGFTPRYVDVTLEDFTMDPAALRQAITPAARVVMPVHLYGHACAMDEITAIAREHRLPVLEDAAQSIGGRHGPALLGSLGEFAIFSFGGTKSLAAGGGGALLFDDDAALEPVTSWLASMPPFDRSPESVLAAQSHWQLYHGAMNLLRLQPELEVDFIWRRASPLFRDLYLHQYPADCGRRLEEGLRDLDAINAARIRRAERYHEQLHDLPLVRSEAWRASGSIWRYTVLLPSRVAANRISASLRANGVNASNHYWSLADLFAGDKSLPNAQEVSTRVVNFWVDASADDASIDRACSLLRQAIERER
jgi:dTDP-4-amino-4,6-dideoxygalactose transaminase